MADTVAGRVYLIRLALGDGLRTPLPMREFAELLSSKGEKVYRSPQISGIETGQRSLALDEVDLFASVDPLNRGRAWLAFGEAPAAPKSGPIYAADEVEPPMKAVPSASLKRTGGGKAG